MTNKELMQRYMVLVKQANLRLAMINEVIEKEVIRAYGDRIAKAESDQERTNLRKQYMIKVTRENIWHADAQGDRNHYIQMAQMYGIAALLDEADGDG